VPVEQWSDFLQGKSVQPVLVDDGASDTARSVLDTLAARTPDRGRMVEF